MSYGVRLARPDELGALPAIELAADVRFEGTRYAKLVATYPPTTMKEFAETQARWGLWVAVDARDRPVGFAHCRLVGLSTLYVGQLSVHPDHAGYGLGARMLRRAAVFHGPRGITRLALTTFRDLPWNAPYYEWLGFREVPDLASEVFLRQQIEEQVEVGFPADTRVAMEWVLGDGTFVDPAVR